MVVTCYLTSAITRYIGIKWAMIVGTMGMMTFLRSLLQSRHSLLTDCAPRVEDPPEVIFSRSHSLTLHTIGYAPYAAGLYCNNVYGNEWFVLVGAALCGITAGIFWSSEAAIAIGYPEPYNQGRFLGFWLSFRLGGQILGGAINLGLNVNNSEAGAVNPKVYLVFIALQCLGPVAGLLLNKPEQVQRTDGLKVKLNIADSPWKEIKATTRVLISKRFLLIIPLIAQAVYTEAVMFTFSSRKYLLSSSCATRIDNVSLLHCPHTRTRLLPLRHRCHRGRKSARPVP